MVQITYRKMMISITQVWFGEPNTIELPCKTDICFFHGVHQESLEKICFFSEFHTLISDLRQSEEELQAKINKNVRYEIRRNCKEKVEYRVFDAEELEKKPDVVKRFADMYELMYQEKGQKKVFNRAQFQAYLETGSIMLTAIYANETPLVFHSYIIGEKQVRLLHSVSNFRSGKLDANLVARANKRMHWEDICLFKDKGKESYDWGGVSSIENPNGIDAFKFKFGGEPLTYYNMYKGKTALGKFVVAFLRIRNKRDRTWHKTKEKI